MAESAIMEAYDELVARLTKVKDGYLEDAKEYPEDFAGIDKQDAIIWMIESFL